MKEKMSTSKIKHLQNRFNELYDKFHMSGWKGWYWIDYLTDFVIYGTSLNDYFAYGFYKLKPNGKNEWITYRRYHKIQDLLNDKNDIDILRDKSKFNVRFSEFVKRESCVFSEMTVDEFKSFFAKHHTVFVKDTQSYRGRGISSYTDGDIDLDKLYKELQETKSVYLLEPKIKEIKSLEDFHPWSINTIRIVTVYDDKKDVVHFMNARIRMGNNKRNVDNFHASGIGANIDIETGIINSIGYDMFENTYIKHPLTGKQIIGFQIPYWEECKKFAEKAAKHLPSVRYVGWDIVIMENGEFLLIEGNDNADHDFQQLHNKGLWKEYKALLEDMGKL